MTLIACQSVKTNTIETSKPFCAVFKPIYYSGDKDTPETITQVREYNAAYEVLCVDVKK